MRIVQAAVPQCSQPAYVYCCTAAVPSQLTYYCIQCSPHLLLPPSSLLAAPSPLHQTISNWQNRTHSGYQHQHTSSFLRENTGVKQHRALRGSENKQTRDVRVMSFPHLRINYKGDIKQSKKSFILCIWELFWLFTVTLKEFLLVNELSFTKYQDLHCLWRHRHIWLSVS